MTVPELIYSGDGNPRFVEIAVSCGFKYGAQLPSTIYQRPYFVDQDWKNPNRETYMAAVRKVKPQVATVLDLEKTEQLNEVLDWAEEISEIAEKIVIIPKVKGIIKRLPHNINGKEVILGYSVPTKYGSTEVPISEFHDWPIHLLGGSPKKQIEIFENINRHAEVRSIDGNYFRMKAVKYCEYWNEKGKWVKDDNKTPNDAHYIVFEKSCRNIIKFWKAKTYNAKL